MFYQQSASGKVTILIAYIDDIILTRDDIVGMENLKKLLANEFEVKDLRFIRYFLGIEATRTKLGIVMPTHIYT